MFVLSVGCLMAQGVFTYQAVVYDGTNLVVNQEVTATVAITDANSHTYTQTLTGITTSPNGLAVLPIGEVGNADFASIDWSTAKITVSFSVDGATVQVANEEQIPAVPYALQSNSGLTTDMIADYIRNASMDDVNAILAATEGNLNDNVSLHDTVLAALIDSMKNNYPLVKDILLSYIDQANANDVETLFTALTGNQDVMNFLGDVVVNNLSTPEGKQMIYEVLVAYAPQLTDEDVDAILTALPDEARNEAAAKALEYFFAHTVAVEDNDPLTINYADEDIHAAIEEIAKYYIEHITPAQVNTLITTIEGNAGAMAKLQPQFNEWMDEYVEKVVKEYLNEHYYLCEDGAPDLCAVNTALQPTTTCLSAPSTFTPPTDANPDYYTATITYGGTTPSTVVPSLFELRYTNGGSVTQSQSVALEYISAVTTDNEIIVLIPTDTVADFYNEYNPDPNQVAVAIAFDGLGCTPDSVEIGISF